MKGIELLEVVYQDALHDFVPFNPERALELSESSQGAKIVITETFDWQKAKITVHRARVRDRLAVDSIQTKLAADADIATIIAVRQFGRILAQSSVEGEVGFPLPPPTASEGDLRAAFNLWLDVDAELMDRWDATLKRVDAALTEPKSDKDGDKNSKK
jgi:hypothetical protein